VAPVLSRESWCSTKKRLPPARKRSYRPARIHKILCDYWVKDSKPDTNILEGTGHVVPFINRTEHRLRRECRSATLNRTPSLGIGHDRTSTNPSRATLGCRSSVPSMSQALIASKERCDTTTNDALRGGTPFPAYLGAPLSLPRPLVRLLCSVHTRRPVLPPPGSALPALLA
jgi:hypothetical protein